MKIKLALLLPLANAFVSFHAQSQDIPGKFAGAHAAIETANHLTEEVERHFHLKGALMSTARQTLERNGYSCLAYEGDMELNFPANLGCHINRSDAHDSCGRFVISLISKDAPAGKAEFLAKSNSIQITDLGGLCLPNREGS